MSVRIPEPRDATNDVSTRVRFARNDLASIDAIEVTRPPLPRDKMRAGSFACDTVQLDGTVIGWCSRLRSSARMTGGGSPTYQPCLASCATERTGMKPSLVYRR
jgi:hypothetical protein